MTFYICQPQEVVNYESLNETRLEFRVNMDGVDNAQADSQPGY